MDNQTGFLSNIRRALGEAPTVKRSKATYPEQFPPFDTTETLKKIKKRDAVAFDLLVEEIQKNGEELNIQNYLCQSLDQAAATVVELIRSKQPEFSYSKHVILHDHADIAALQLWNRFNHEAITLHTTFSADRQGREKAKASFIGITAPNVAVADSATLVQMTSPGQPSSTSLLPSIHIAIVRRENLVADLDEAYALIAEETTPNNFILISGPSKTADIESEMVHGAHGPRELHLIILAEPHAPPTAEADVSESEDAQEEIEEAATPVSSKPPIDN